MSKLIIKASEIANLTDARYFSAREADWLGFSLDSNSENYISPLQIIAIREWISGPGIVVELGSVIHPENLTEVIDLIKPDALQVGPYFSYQHLPDTSSLVLIRELIPDSLDQLREYEYEWRSWNNAVTFFLLNLEKNGFSWSTVKSNENALKNLQQLCREFNVMISIAFDPAEMNELLTALKPFGLSLMGGAEEKVGMKSFEILDDIFDMLEAI